MGPEQDNASRRIPAFTERRASIRAGRRAGDPLVLATSPEDLDTLIDALETFAAAVPPGRALFTAIHDPEAGASDLVIRDGDGDTRLILGLEHAQHHRLEVLLAWVRGEIDPGNDDVAWEMASLAADSGAPAAPMPTSGAGAGEIDFEAILQQVPFPLLVVDDAVRITYASRAVVTHLGMRDPAQLLGIELSEVIHPADRAEVSGLLTDLGEAQAGAGIRLLRWDGLYAHAGVSASRLPGSESTVLALTPTDSAAITAERTGADGAPRWQMWTGTRLGTIAP